MIEKCGPGCVADSPLLDTADGREHDNCLDTEDNIEDLLRTAKSDATRCLHERSAPPWFLSVVWRLIRALERPRRAA